MIMSIMTYLFCRLGRSHMGYGSSRTSLSAQDGLYGSRQGMSYGGGIQNSFLITTNI